MMQPLGKTCNCWEGVEVAHKLIWVANLYFFFIYFSEEKMQADASERKLIAADPTAAVFLLDLSGCGNRKIHVHEFCDGAVWPLKEPHKRISQEWTFTKTNLRWSHILPLSPLSAHPQWSLVLEALNYH